MYIDPELKYCPQCDEEYRREIERCAHCKVSLITGQERLASETAEKQRREARSGKISEDDDLVQVRKGTLHELKPLEEALHVEQIATMLAGDERSCGKGCCPTVFYLLVRREEAYDAMRIIETEFRRTTKWDSHDTSHVDSVYDPLAGNATCPACGHSFSTVSTECPECGLCFG